MCYTCCILAIKPLNKKLEERRRKAAEAAEAAGEETAVDGAAEDTASPAAAGSLTDGTGAPLAGSPGMAATSPINEQPAPAVAMAIPQSSGESIRLESLPSTAQPPSMLQQELAEDTKQAKERKRLTKVKKEKKVRLSEVDTIIPSPLPISGQSSQASSQPGPSVELEPRRPETASLREESEQQQQQEQPRKLSRPSRPKGSHARPDPAKQPQPQSMPQRLLLQEPSPPETTRIVRAKELIAFAASQLRFPGFGRRSDGPATSPKNKEGQKQPAEKQRPLQNFDGSAAAGASIGSSSVSAVELLAPTPRRPVSMRFPFMGTASAGAYDSSSGSVDDGGDGANMPLQSSEATVVRRRAKAPCGRALVFAPGHAGPGSSAFASTTAHTGSSTDDSVAANAGTDASDRCSPSSPRSTRHARSPTIYYPARSSLGSCRLSPPASAEVPSRPSTNQVFQAAPEFAADGGSHALRARSAASASSAMNSSNHLLLGIAKMPAYRAPAGAPG